MKRTSLLLFVLVSWAASAPADAPEPIRLLGKTALTPDGATLVFAWRGDIWRAPTGGGDARRLTFHPARDARPVVSRDGTTIAFQSNRSGSNQVFLMPLDGGSPRRITTHTEGSEPLDFYPDDKGVLYSGSRDHFWRRAGRLYFKRTELRTASVLVFDDYARDATLTADGRHIAFTREGTAWWRKQYTGSQASQIWIYDTAARAFTRMTDGTHEERWPLWHPNGKAIYYVSQQSGANNLYLRDLDSGHVEQLTHYTDDGVLFPSISRDGSTLVYRHLFDLYRMDLRRGGSAQKLPLSYGGDPIHDPQRRTMLNRANQVAFSEDGREVVFASGGDLWVMDTELREPVQLTATSEEERDPAFAPDFSAIVFVSDAGGHPDLHKLERADPKKHWWQGREFKRTALTSDAAVERAPRFTPDGRVSFLKERGDLWTMKPDGSDARVLLKGWNAPSYSFSPDGQWLAYAVNDNDFNRDIWVRKADGSGDPVNVSRHPDWESNPTWSPDGKLLAFTGQRSHDESDIYYVWLQQD
ncbi:MAG: DPP IV N-terminal domain-containing protein, partial [Planctomycetota bacterium]|nr:DPP IV N-terminal domain-containing protein [Planctomycetota bacterium]